MVQIRGLGFSEERSVAEELVSCWDIDGNCDSETGLIL